MVQREDDNMNIPPNQASGIAVEALEKQIVDWGVADENPGEHGIVRFKFAHTPATETLSQNQPPSIAEFFHSERKKKVY